LGDGKALAHGYRNLQHWNQWLSQQFLGRKCQETEANQFAHVLSRHFGKHAILIGVPNQYDLLNATKIPCHSLVTPLTFKDKQPGYIEGDFHEIPVLTGSMDLVMLPHTLEFVDNPRQLLSEACRIIKPEGLIVISGFNPYSAWGARKLLGKVKNKNNMPWGASFIQSAKVKHWLELSDFAMESHKSILFTPPINRPKLYKKLHFLEKVGSVCFPIFGGVYILIARAKVVPLTPIRLKWKQQLTGIRISRTISGHIA